MGLVSLLVPLIPNLIQGIMNIVDVIRGHPDTPDAVKAQLDKISSDLDAVAAKVAAVQLP